jgi:MFS transporter, Spinster family, sphingosine-1-phosphate transporter
MTNTDQPRIKTNLSGRWFVIAIFFGFMLLHQIDMLLIGPLTSSVIDTFKITYTQMGLVTTGALVVGTVLYPIWGWLYDRFSRAKLLALAAFIWGSTTWLGAIAPTYPLFVAARATTGIDDSSYPGIYSLVSDYFEPGKRGKIYGLLEISSPLGYLIGMVMAMFLGGVIGWRGVFYITGSLGLLVAALMFFFLKEAPRGQAEPEMQGMETITLRKFSWKAAFDMFKRPTLIMLFIQGFFGSFPWNVIAFWFFVYLEKERGYSSDAILFTMAPAVIIMAAGYPAGGALGDWLFKKNMRGRMFVSAFGVIAGAILLLFTMNIGMNQNLLFMIMLCATGFFVPFASTNVVSTVFDITLPEVRSTANAVEKVIEGAGAMLAPLITGIIADKTSLKNAIIILCVGAWLICFAFFISVIALVPRDIDKMRNVMAERARLEKAAQASN